MSRQLVHHLTPFHWPILNLNIDLSISRALQDLVEVVMSVKSAVERQFGQEIAIGGVGGQGGNSIDI